MKKLAYVCLCLPFFGAAQSNDSLLQEGKILFRNADTMQFNISLKKKKLTEALHIFQKALVESPQKSEAHYFCGYGIDRLYILNGKDSATRDFIMPATYAGTEASSLHFEWILKNEKTYSGEKFILNPAGKVTSIWGALGLHYWLQGKSDSCKMAFSEGKKRGGFTPQYLELGKNMLNSCPPNAVLFTWGDNDSYPLWYLQQIEHFRKDVAVLNLSLMQTAWFVKFAQKEWKVPFGMTDAQIDKLPEYFYPYETEQRRVALPKQADFRWKLEASGYNYLLRSDYMIAALVQANAFRRPFCYALTTSQSNRNFINPYLHYRGLILETLPTEPPSADRQPRTDAITLKKLKNLSFEALKSPSTLADNDYLVYSTTAQYSFLMPLSNAIEKKDWKTAKQIFALFEQELPKKAVARDKILDENMENMRQLLDKN